MRGLTKRQQSVLDTIHNHIEREGYPPTVREIGLALELRSSCTVQKHLEALIRKGFLKRDGSKSRTIEIVREEGPPRPDPRDLVSVPLVGQVAAGQPILAEEYVEGYIPIAREFLPSDDVFMLRVRGDSMIEAGIFDGDLVVVKKQNTAENGDMVVAMTPEGEATVKYFRRDGKRFRLDPANSSMEPMFVDELEILGKPVLTLHSLT